MTKQEIISRLQEIIDDNKDDVNHSICTFMPFMDVLTLLEEIKDGPYDS